MQLDDLHIDERYKVYYSNGPVLDRYEGAFKGFLKTNGTYRIEMQNNKSFTQIPTANLRRIEPLEN